MKFIDYIIPDRLYLSEFSWMLLILLYLPFLVWLLRVIWKKLRIGRGWRVAIMMTITAIAIVIPLGDVYISSLQMEKYCKAEAGTHIYKTDIVDGFFFNIFHDVRLEVDRYSYLFKYGYNYYEMEHRKKYYFVTKEDDQIIVQENDLPLSEYEFIYESNIINRYLVRQKYIIREIHSDNEIATWVEFSFYPGWMDRLIANLMGGYSPPHCGIPKFNASEFYLSVLKPSG